MSRCAQVMVNNKDFLGFPANEIKWGDETRQCLTEVFKKLMEKMGNMKETATSSSETILRECSVLLIPLEHTEGPWERTDSGSYKLENAKISVQDASVDVTPRDEEMLKLKLESDIETGGEREEDAHLVAEERGREVCSVDASLDASLVDEGILKLNLESDIETGGEREEDAHLEAEEGKREANYVDASLDASLVDEGTFEFKKEYDVETEGWCERGEDAPLGVVERKREANRIDTSVDLALGDAVTLKMKTDCETGVGRERGKETPLGVKEKMGRRKHFRCHLCRKNIQTKDILITHLKIHGYDIHEEGRSEGRDVPVNGNVNRKSKCNYDEIRGKGAKNASDTAKNDDRGRFVCVVCGRGFKRLSDLKRHSMTHTGERPYPCDLCGKSFAASFTLKTHMAVHTGEKPYACKLCDKRFCQHSNLVVHVRYHSGEKRHPCEVCKMRFTTTGDLKNHLRTHSDKKPYRCEFCGKEFLRNAGLKWHSRVHGGEN